MGYNKNLALEGYFDISAKIPFIYYYSADILKNQVNQLEYPGSYFVNGNSSASGNYVLFGGNYAQSTCVQQYQQVSTIGTSNYMSCTSSSNRVLKGFEGIEDGEDAEAYIGQVFSVNV